MGQLALFQNKMADRFSKHFPIAKPLKVECKVVQALRL
jgi:hypothetical protein